MKKRITFKYVICFIKTADTILLIQRKKEPWKSRFNGLGGKIHLSETPKQAVYREVLEETNIDITKAKSINFTGVVTWNMEVEPNAQVQSVYGMYVYIVEVKEQISWEGQRHTVEGMLVWKPISWVTNKNNDQIAHNIPYFLPPMLHKQAPARYHCNFEGSIFKSITKKDLPMGMQGS